MQCPEYVDLRFELARNGDLRVTGRSATGARVRIESISCETWMCERIARKRLSSDLERLLAAIDLATKVLARATPVGDDTAESRVDWSVRILESALTSEARTLPGQPSSKGPRRDDPRRRRK
ncbi:MAG: hypothetical protein AAF726_22680 [Planctomycetota bacterium]